MGGTVRVDLHLQTMRGRRCFFGHVFEIRRTQRFGDVLSSPPSLCTCIPSPLVVTGDVSSTDERSNASPVSGKIDPHVRSNPPPTAYD